MLDIEEFLRGGNAQARRPECHEHKAGNDEQDNRGGADQDLAVDAGDGPRMCPELQSVRCDLALWSRALGIAGAGGGHWVTSRHTAWVRTMRTIRCGAVPSLSSAAANRRSTM